MGVVMSMYAMMSGGQDYKKAIILLPILGKKMGDFPRFRDIFLTEEGLEVLTRTGGGNREAYTLENDKIREMGGFIRDYDEPDDTTYASWVFAIPVDKTYMLDHLKETGKPHPDHIALIKSVMEISDV